jgi:hypothetical protein
VILPNGQYKIIVDRGVWTIRPLIGTEGSRLVYWDSRGTMNVLYLPVNGDKQTLATLRQVSDSLSHFVILDTTLSWEDVEHQVVSRKGRFYLK